MLIPILVLLTIVGIGWYLFTRLRMLVRSGVAFGASLQNQAESISAALDVPPVVREVEPVLSPSERRKQARATRRRIAQVRGEKRNARLMRARNRWAVVTSRSYPRLAGWAEARAEVQLRKSERHANEEA